MTDTQHTPVDGLRVILRGMFPVGTEAQEFLDEITLELTGRTTVHAHQDVTPRRFVLRRREDVSGVSGTGDVADGTLWPDGTASVRWRGEHPSIVFWDRGRASVELIHGHDGRTTIEWHDDETGQSLPAPAGDQPAALRRAIDRALTAPVGCPKCGRTMACPCVDEPRHEQRVDAILTAVSRWVA